VGAADPSQAVRAQQVAWQIRELCRTPHKLHRVNVTAVVGLSIEELLRDVDAQLLR